MMNGIYQDKKFVCGWACDCPLNMINHKRGDSMDAHVDMINARAVRALSGEAGVIFCFSKWMPVNPANMKIKSIKRKSNLAIVKFPSRYMRTTVHALTSRDSA
jgi:hypothetical protein